MNKLYYFFILSISAVLISCTSDDTSNLKRCKTIDISGLTLYGGPPNAGKIDYESDDEAKKIGLDDYRMRLVNRYFGLPFDEEKKHIQKISFEFEGNRVTYIDENNAGAYPLDILDQKGDIIDKRKINQIVSTYEFQNDSLFIYLDDGNRFFAAGRTKTGDTLVVKRGFSFYRKASGSAIKMDTTRIIDSRIAFGYAGYSGVDNMLKGDTVVFCNVIYKIY